MPKQYFDSMPTCVEYINYVYIEYAFLCTVVVCIEEVRSLVCTKYSPYTKYVNICVDWVFVHAPQIYLCDSHRFDG